MCDKQVPHVVVLCLCIMSLAQQAVLDQAGLLGGWDGDTCLDENRCNYTLSTGAKRSAGRE